MDQWPETIACENATRGKKINTQHDTFTLVTYAGNVVFHAGSSKQKTGNCSHVICEKCTRLSLGKFKRKNKFLEGVNMKAAMIFLISFICLSTVGCANLGQPVNLELAERNDTNVRSVVQDNENLRVWLGKTLKGDTGWNKDAQGQPLFDDAISSSMAIRNDAAVKTAAEVKENAKLGNK